MDLINQCLMYSQKAYDDKDSEGELLRVGSHEVWIYSEGAFTFVAFRGTEPDIRDIITDLRTLPRRVYGGWCHAGFKAGVDSLAPFLNPILIRHILKGQKVVLTGHSMGGSLATLYGYLHPLPCSVVAIAPAPCLRIKHYPVPAVYLVNGPDPVTRMSFLGLYRHYGERVQFGEPKGRIYGILTVLFYLRSLIKDASFHPIQKYREAYSGHFYCRNRSGL